MPIINASEKYLIDSPPKKNIAISESSIVKVVFKDLLKVCIMLLWTNSPNFSLMPNLRTFSLTRSNTTTVSETEKPNMVRAAATKTAPISMFLK